MARARSTSFTFSSNSANLMKSSSYTYGRVSISTPTSNVLHPPVHLTRAVYLCTQRVARFYSSFKWVTQKLV